VSVSENKMTNEEFSPETALARLREHVDSIPPSRGSIIARVPDLDVVGLLAFSVMPSTGLAGEITYLVGPDEMLSTGLRDTFEVVMDRMGVGRAPDVLEVHRFAHLFMRLRAHRRGVVLDAPDGHILLRPDQLPPAEFSPPEATFDVRGAHFRFWIYDTDRMEPVFFEVTVAADGKTSFSAAGVRGPE
jgi:hypothetical protein